MPLTDAETELGRAPKWSPRAVVFDFGGVLITPITNQIHKIADANGATAVAMREVLLGPRESGAGHPWHRAERGEIAVAEIQGLLGPWAEPLDVPLHGDEIERMLAAGEYSVVDKMVACVDDVRRAGHATGLLTNTFAEFRPTLERDLDLAMFDVVIESYAVASRKPEQFIYEATADALGVAHDRIVYLDDFDQNLEPADALGWTTIHVSDPAAAIRELGDLLPG